MFLNDSMYTKHSDSWELDVFVESYIPKTVNEIDQFPQIVEEWLVCLLKFLHSDSVFEYRFIY